MVTFYLNQVMIMNIAFKFIIKESFKEIIVKFIVDLVME